MFKKAGNRSCFIPDFLFYCCLWNELGGEREKPAGKEFRNLWVNDPTPPDYSQEHRDSCSSL
jgi:hypothetical protein